MRVKGTRQTRLLSASMIAPTVESNPFTFLGFRLVTSVSFISKVRSSRDLHLSFCLKADGASQSAGRPESVLDFWGVTVGRAVFRSIHHSLFSQIGRTSVTGKTLETVPAIRWEPGPQLRRRRPAWQRLQTLPLFGKLGADSSKDANADTSLSRTI